MRPPAGLLSPAGALPTFRRPRSRRYAAVKLSCLPGERLQLAGSSVARPGIARLFLVCFQALLRHRCRRDFLRGELFEKQAGSPAVNQPGLSFPVFDGLHVYVSTAREILLRPAGEAAHFSEARPSQAGTKQGDEAEGFMPGKIGATYSSSDQEGAMKTAAFLVFCALGLSLASPSFAGSEFCDGFEMGYKTVKGNMVIVPICPIGPITPIGSTDYQEGIKAGMAKALSEG